MDYNNLVKDFAQRTRENLAYIDAAHARGENVYEVTQLVNSLLGLLIFPQQRWVNRVPRIGLEELVRRGWPEIHPTPRIQADAHFQQADNLHDLVRVLRNSIAHCNIEISDVDANNEICGLRIWNINRQGDKTWEAELSIADLRALAENFAVLMTQDPRNWGSAAGGEHP
ncbi:MAG: hypothetical protein HPY85_16905 [Anaerolineae bacterium]|nr:hypothetical protein [Anaerolineae bacterium]